MHLVIIMINQLYCILPLWQTYSHKRQDFSTGFLRIGKKTTWGNKDNMFIFLWLKWNNAWPWIKSGENIIFTFVMKRLNVNFRETKKTNTIILLPVKLIWPCMVVIEARVQEKGTRREGIRNEKLSTPNTIHSLLVISGYWTWSPLSSWVFCSPFFLLFMLLSSKEPDNI